MGDRGRRFQIGGEGERRRYLSVRTSFGAKLADKQTRGECHTHSSRNP
jgi:hypothetical protein